ncbi:hypothetical protein ACOME3_002150 [Neoechinorhynchus agilis]
MFFWKKRYGYMKITSGDEALRSVLLQQLRLLERLLSLGENNKQSSKIKQVDPFFPHTRRWEDSGFVSLLGGKKEIADHEFNELVRLLDNHFNQPMHFAAARFAFNQCEMGAGQNCLSWIAELRDRARLCKFFDN